MNPKCCLFCGNAEPAEAINGSEVLVCFSFEGYEGKEIMIDDEDCCCNYKPTVAAHTYRKVANDLE